jgi:hypothetical protein
VAETTGLLNRRTGHSVPGVRIPPSPQYKLRSEVFSGYSAVRLAHLVWDQGVVGSNPTTPTIFKSVYYSACYGRKTDTFLRTDKTQTFFILDGNTIC